MEFASRTSRSKIAIGEWMIEFYGLPVAEHNAVDRGPRGAVSRAIGADHDSVVWAQSFACPSDSFKAAWPGQFEGPHCRSASLRLHCCMETGVRICPLERSDGSAILRFTCAVEFCNKRVMCKDGQTGCEQADGGHDYRAVYAARIGILHRYLAA